jgi:galactoside O-acetyltransferase
MRALIAKVLNAVARRRVLRHPGVRIAADAKVQFDRISLRTGCTLRIGDRSIVEGSLQFDREGAAISIGARTFVGGSLLVSAERIELGDDVLMAWGCTVVDHDSHDIDWDGRRNDVGDWYDGRKDWSRVERAAVRIGDRTWIGFNVSILKGVTIGEGAVVGAGSVVTGDVEPYVLVAGNPARVIRKLGPGEAASNPGRR